MATPEETDPATLSRDATWSTVEPDPDVEEQYPPAGPQSVEKRGVPGEVDSTKASKGGTASSGTASKDKGS